jgi:hypothetical protein
MLKVLSGYPKGGKSTAFVAIIVIDRCTTDQKGGRSLGGK